MGEKCLKHTLTYLDCIKYNEINIGHSNIKRMFPIKNDIKKYKDYVYRLTQKFSYTLHPMEEKF